MSIEINEEFINAKLNELETEISAYWINLFGDASREDILALVETDSLHFLETPQKAWLAGAVNMLKLSERQTNTRAKLLCLNKSRDFLRISIGTGIGERITKRYRQKAIAKEPRPDALTLLISEIVQSNPEITDKELLRKLEDNKHQGVIEDIDDENIWFVGKGNKPDSAKISGLKDRLSRIKKSYSR